MDHTKVVKMDHTKVVKMDRTKVVKTQFKMMRFKFVISMSR